MKIYSLRDFFAAAAMNGMLAGAVTAPADIPGRAYDLAEKMIEESNQRDADDEAAEMAEQFRQDNR